MRKLLMCITLILAALLVFVGCQKETATEEPEATMQEETQEMPAEDTMMDTTMMDTTMMDTTMMDTTMMDTMMHDTAEAHGGGHGGY